MQNSANTGFAQRDNHRHERLAAMKATIDALAADQLTSHEATDLQAMREEEKIARDVYVQLFNKWSLRKRPPEAVGLVLGRTSGLLVDHPG
jgi:hypothetical protein